MPQNIRIFMISYPQSSVALQKTVYLALCVQRSAKNVLGPFKHLAGDQKKKPKTFITSEFFSPAVEFPAAVRMALLVKLADVE